MGGTRPGRASVLPGTLDERDGVEDVAMGTDHPPELRSDGMDDSLPRAVGGIDRAGVREVCCALSQCILTW